MYRLIMAGGGHAQLSVLETLAQKSLGIDAVLITPSPYQIYSGVLPGWIAGHYSLSECRIDLRPLAASAGARLIFAQVVGIDAKQYRISRSDGMHLDYDGLSLDVGSEADLSLLEVAKRLLPIKPLGNFVQRWPAILTPHPNRTVSAGGGGGRRRCGWRRAGICRAICFCHATVQASFSRVGRFGGRHLAGSVQSGVKRHVAVRCWSSAALRCISASSGYLQKGLRFPNGQSLLADCIIAATGARPSAWLCNSGLALDEQGYVLVESQHRSISHFNVFAAGDVCMRSDIQLAHSGVHAVFAGPVLAHNLIAAINGRILKSYWPRKKSLYLLATGPKHAIASWGAFSAQGHWVWRWKDWIDRRFMHKNGTLNRLHNGEK